MRTLTPEGNLTIPDYRATLHKLESEIDHSDDLLIDLGRLGDVDSVAVVALIGIVRQMHFNGRKVLFANVPKLLAGLVALYEADDFFREAE